ncbi:hypothetical protein PROVRETT_08180 [Providencia rettgeri DSM 1131]|nr:hypothetical protein PROVRETT_08180 [Providencia rettgeri DSM 1131]
MIMRLIFIYYFNLFSPPLTSADDETVNNTNFNVFYVTLLIKHIKM